MLRVPSFQIIKYLNINLQIYKKNPKFCVVSGFIFFTLCRYFFLIIWKDREIVSISNFHKKCLFFLQLWSIFSTKMTTPKKIQVIYYSKFSASLTQCYTKNNWSDSLGRHVTHLIFKNNATILWLGPCPSFMLGVRSKLFCPRRCSL